MRPTLRERIRWWKWAFVDYPHVAGLISGRYARETRRVLLQRHWAREPWPRVRNNRWMYPL